MGQVHSHLSEEERQIIQIEIDNGTSIRRIAGLIGRHASTVSREIVLLQCLLGGFGSVFPQHPIEHIHTPTPSWTGSYTTPPSWKPANTTCANTRPSGSRPPKKKNRNGTGSVQRQARRCRPTITPVPFRNNTRYSNLQIISHCLVNQPAMPRFDGIAYFLGFKTSCK